MDTIELIGKCVALTSAIDAEGELPLKIRQHVRRMLDNAHADQGTNVWAHLELSCARRAWPIWLSKFPTEETPIRFVEQAEIHLRASQAGFVSPSSLAELQTLLDNKLLLGEEFLCATYAGFACWAAARTVFLPAPPVSDARSELDYDPESWDASFHACLAFTGGATWERSRGDNAKRRAFWEWFLTEAITEVLSRRVDGAVKPTTKS